MVTVSEPQPPKKVTKFELQYAIAWLLFFKPRECSNFLSTKAAYKSRK